MPLQSIGKIKPLDPACVREAHNYRLKPRAVAATFCYFARHALKQGARCAGVADRPLAIAREVVPSPSSFCCTAWVRLWHLQ